MEVSQTVCVWERCLDPSPYPLPLDLDGAPRERSERPRWPKMAPRGPQRAQDGLQDRARYPKMVQDSYQHASKSSRDGPRTAPSAFRALHEALKRPKSFNSFVFSDGFALSPFRIRWALEASRWPQDGPREPQEGPKRAPRRPQERPRALQERPKRAPRRSF